jgi:hypothetical protein
MALLIKLLRADYAADSPEQWREVIVIVIITGIIIIVINIITVIIVKVEILFDSLMQIVTTYEVHGEGTDSDSRVASAAFQNQDAQAEPVNSRQWAGIAKDLVPGFQIGTPCDSVMGMLTTVLSKYNDRADVQDINYMRIICWNT